MEECGEAGLAAARLPDVLRNIGVALGWERQLNQPRKSGRGGRIRTGGPLRPRQVRYQAALRPDALIIAYLHHMPVSAGVAAPRLAFFLAQTADYGAESAAMTAVAALTRMVALELPIFPVFASV